MRWVGIGWLTLSFCMVTLGSPAVAQQSAQAEGAPAGPTAGRDKAARDLFNAGRTAFSEGLFVDAMKSFQRAYELSQRPQLLFNVGMAADSARLDSEALAAFEQYLREIPDAENREYVEARIATLKDAAKRGSSPAPATSDLTVLDGRQAGPSAPAGATQEPPARKEDSRLLKKWWFWTAIGTGVAAVAVTGIVLSTGDSEEPQKGDVGGVIKTLEVAR